MQVFVWALPNSGRSLSDYEFLDTLVTFQPYRRELCSTILWLSATVLVTGNADNSNIKLWYVTDIVQLLQTVTFTNTEESSNPTFFNHMDVQADTGLLVLANSRQLALYTLHFNGNDDMLRFDYLADFSVSQPIMSFTVQFDPADNPPALHLYCTQPQAIQNYTLNPALCRPSGTTPLPDQPQSAAPTQQAHSGPMSYANLEAAKSVSSPSGHQSPPASSHLQHQANHTTPQPPSSAGRTKQVPMNYMERLKLSAQQAVQPVPPLSLPSEQQSPSASSQLQPPAIRTTPQPPSPAGPTEQPRLLTPTHLMKQATRSASQSSMASLPSLHTPQSTARSVVDNTDAVSTASTQGSKLQDGSVSRQHSAETIPSSAAALDASTSAQYDSPTATLSESRANTPPPSTPALPPAAYLTPEQYNPHRQSSPAQQSTGSQPDLRLDLVHKPGTSDQVNVKLLRRDDKGTAEEEAGPSQQPPAAPSAVFSQPLDLLRVSNATQAPQLPVDPPLCVPPRLPAPPQPLRSQAAPGVDGAIGQARTPMDSLAGSLGRSTELSDSAVRTIADAVADRTRAQHKQLLSNLNDRHREMLRVIKGDIREEGKRLQVAFDAQVSLCSTLLPLRCMLPVAWCICMYMVVTSILQTPPPHTPPPPRAFAHAHWLHSLHGL